MRRPSAYLGHFRGKTLMDRTQPWVALADRVKFRGNRVAARKGCCLRFAGKNKGQRACARRPSKACALPGHWPESNDYWFNGLKTRIAASAVEQAPAGSTRTTASSSAQKPRIPVWLIDSGTAEIV